MRRERSQEKGGKRRRRKKGLNRETDAEQGNRTCARTQDGGWQEYLEYTLSMKDMLKFSKETRRGREEFLYVNSESWRF